MIRLKEVHLWRDVRAEELHNKEVTQKNSSRLHFSSRKLSTPHFLLMQQISVGETSHRPQTVSLTENVA